MSITAPNRFPASTSPDGDRVVVGAGPVTVDAFIDFARSADSSSFPPGRPGPRWVDGHACRNDCRGRLRGCSRWVAHRRAKRDAIFHKATGRPSQLARFRLPLAGSGDPRRVEDCSGAC